MPATGALLLVMGLAAAPTGPRTAPMAEAVPVVLTTPTATTLATHRRPPMRRRTTGRLSRLHQRRRRRRPGDGGGAHFARLAHGTAGTRNSGGDISVNLGGSISKPSQSITIIIALTLLAVAPSLLILLTSFTRIIIVLSLTRQALGLQNVPPNQLLAGLALFLSLFIMSPVISQVNSHAVQPYLAGKITAEQAYTDAQAPIKTWMLKQTQADDLAIFEKGAKPASARRCPWPP